MTSHDFAPIHLLFTSRPEPDIVIRLNRVHQLLYVRLQSTVLERDIALYLDEQVSHWDGNTHELLSKVY